ncbi:PH domain-containing protein [Bremerella cremea]|uniref:PH domain-containing protein n=1 Tax=Bremerella cremea TaxID=1031537 RepID=A0A368KSK7_9BACT|nr:PH domain-containing protein [Bremerella cremea]RCS47704.1 PH domain-containing protein [Bremerella cremea]
MKQAIAGLSLSSQHEATAIVVWPSVSASEIGQKLGRLYEKKEGKGIFTLGNLFVLLSIPLAIPLYLWNFLPVVGTRYRITNRQVIVERGIQGVSERQMGLGDFDRIEIVQQSGQAWFRSADMIFWQQKPSDVGESPQEVEVLRLPGVPYPEVFRAACQKAAMTYRGFREIHQRQATGP